MRLSDYPAKGWRVVAAGTHKGAVSSHKPDAFFRQGFLPTPPWEDTALGGTSSPAGRQW